MPSPDISMCFWATSALIVRDGALGERLLVHERHFTEEVPLLHDGKNDLTAILCDQHHLHLTGHDNVERIARVVRKQNNLVPRKPPRLEETREQFQVSLT